MKVLLFLILTLFAVSGYGESIYLPVKSNSRQSEKQTVELGQEINGHLVAETLNAWEKKNPKREIVFIGYLYEYVRSERDILPLRTKVSGVIITHKAKSDGEQSPDKR